ncbi:MAG: DUF4342 domain-containing protein [bacterium]|nr:DUF4342 domain-containing protein [bacterium]
MADKKKEEKTFIEEIEINAAELVEQVKKLIAEGNVRRLIIKKANDDLLLEIPLNTGVAVGSVLTLLAPVITVLGGMAALLAKVKIQIVRIEK